MRSQPGLAPDLCARPESARADPARAKIPEGGRFAAAALVVSRVISKPTPTQQIAGIARCDNRGVARELPQAREIEMVAHGDTLEQAAALARSIEAEFAAVTTEFSNELETSRANAKTT